MPAFKTERSQPRVPKYLQAHIHTLTETDETANEPAFLNAVSLAPLHAASARVLERHPQCALAARAAAPYENIAPTIKPRSVRESSEVSIQITTSKSTF